MSARGCCASPATVRPIPRTACSIRACAHQPDRRLTRRQAAAPDRRPAQGEPAISEPVGTLDTALAHTGRLLGGNPAMAAEQAREILKAVPGHPQAELLL